MNLKHPLILKQQPIPNNTSLHKVDDPHELLNELSLPPQGEEEEEMNEQFQDLQQLESPPPVENITVLKSKQQPAQEQLKIDVLVKKGEEPQQQTPKKQQLQQILNEKVKIVHELRLSINDKKKEMKNIGDQIGKDLDKSLLKASKQTIVSIRDIFAQTPKASNQKVNDLNEELKKIRLIIKKIKQDIQKIQDELSDPVVVINQEKSREYEVKIRSAAQEIKSIENEKNMLAQEIVRSGGDINQEEKQKVEDLSKLSIQLTNIQSQQKDYKLQIYRIEKEDILLMQKVKFFQERQSSLRIKRRPNQKDKETIQLQIKQLIEEINETMQERNRTQIEKKQQAKHLTTQATSLENKNWQLCNKLREIDSFLLQYYQKKSRRKEMKHLERTIDVMQKSGSRKVETYTGMMTQHLSKSKFSQNDKNFQSVQLASVERKKIYQFGCKEPFQNQINLSDEFLGSRLNIKRLVFTCDKQKIYSVEAKYKNNFSNEVSGFIMSSKVLPQKIDVLELILEQNEVINLIHTGYSEGSFISFLNIVTSEGKQLKWGSLQNLIKSDQKHIKKYETSFIKSKIAPDSNQQKNFSTFLAGFTLVTTYMSAK